MLPRTSLTRGQHTEEMTRRYAKLMTEDLQAIHQRVALLTA
jgi:hypothetical protein